MSSELLTSTAGPLIASAVTVLAIIAYRHPRSFAPVSLVLNVLCLAGMVCFTAYNMGVWAGVGAARTALLTLPPGSASQALEKVSGVSDAETFPMWLTWVLMGMSLYVLLLTKLPAIGITQDKAEPRR